MSKEVIVKYGYDFTNLLVIKGKGLVNLPEHGIVKLTYGIRQSIEVIDERTYKIVLKDGYDIWPFFHKPVKEMTSWIDVFDYFDSYVLDDNEISKPQILTFVAVNYPMVVTNRIPAVRDEYVRKVTASHIGESGEISYELKKEIADVNLDIDEYLNDWKYILSADAEINLNWCLSIQKSSVKKHKDLVNKVNTRLALFKLGVEHLRHTRNSAWSMVNPAAIAR